MRQQRGVKPRMWKAGRYELLLFGSSSTVYPTAKTQLKPFEMTTNRIGLFDSPKNSTVQEVLPHAQWANRFQVPCCGRRRGGAKRSAVGSRRLESKKSEGQWVEAEEIHEVPWGRLCFFLPSLRFFRLVLYK